MPRYSQKLFIRMLLVILPVLALLVIIYFVSNYSYVVLTVPENNQETTYNFLNQSSNTEKIVKSKNPRIKQLLHAGSYEITTHTSDGNYYSIVNAGRFLSSKKITVKLSKEESRRFIGNNPSSCMVYTGSVLLSYSCGSTPENITTHIPATRSLPTYTITNNEQKMNASIEGTSQIADGTALILLHSTRNGDTLASHSLYVLNGSTARPVSTTLIKNLTNLYPDQDYTLKQYKNGFIIYDRDFKNAYYYDSPTKDPEQLQLTIPSDSTLPLISVETTKATITATYGYSGDPGNSRTEVILYKNDAVKKYAFRDKYSSAYPCGKEKLCLLENKKMTVFNIGSSAAVKLYSVNNVQGVLDKDTQLLLANSLGVLAFDADTQTGYYPYLSEGYSITNLRTYLGGLIVSVVSPDKKSSALLFDGTNGDTTIDKKILAIKGPNIKSISVYDKYVYITPELGPLVENQDDNGFSYDKTRVAATATEINQLIDKAGIDRTKYTIINTAL